MKERGKKMQISDFRSKNDLKPSIFDELKRKNLERIWSFSHNTKSFIYMLEKEYYFSHPMAFSRTL